jgi:hypothetical protein
MRSPSLLSLLLGVALLGLSACSRPMPPNGTARLSLTDDKTAPGLRPHQSRSEVVFNIDYAGSRKFLEYEIETWIKGVPQPKPHRSRDVIDGPRNTYRLAIKDGLLKGKKTYGFEKEMQEVKRWGGTAKKGSSFSLPAPEESPGWAATLLPATSIDVADGENVAVWGILLHREKLDLPAGTSLEAAAAKADAALLYRLRFAD